MMQVCNDPTFINADLSSLVHVITVGAPVSRTMYEKITSVFRPGSSPLPIIWE